MCKNMLLFHPFQSRNPRADSLSFLTLTKQDANRPVDVGGNQSELPFREQDLEGLSTLLLRRTGCIMHLFSSLFDARVANPYNTFKYDVRVNLKENLASKQSLF